MKIETKSTAREQDGLHKFSKLIAYKNFYTFFVFLGFTSLRQLTICENSQYLSTKQCKPICVRAWTGPKSSRKLWHTDV